MFVTHLCIRGGIMSNAIKVIFAIIITLSTVGCSTNINEIMHEKDNRISVLEIENNSLNEKLSSLESDKKQLESELKDINRVALLDMNYEYRKRFIPKNSEIRPIPISSVKPFRVILTNSVIDVIDSVYNNGQIWLYVSIPVYDTPLNNKGWVLESETVPLTEDAVKLVQSNVTLRKGTPIYNGEFITQKESIQPTNTSNEVSGRIERRQGSFVYIMSPGGWYFWVEEKYIVYPKVDD